MQDIRGTVVDGVSGKLLVGAAVQLTADRGTYTDSTGRFTFSNVPVGRYQIVCTFLGYDSLQLVDIVVRAAKPTVVDITLEPGASSLGLVTVEGQAPGGSSLMPGQIGLSKEAVLRYPATYFDPARLALAYPGVSGTNDQANGMSVRGHSPNAVGWRLQGAEIVNPNHTPNAGTSSDRTTLNGGGVNILSAQLFSDTRFYTGLLPARYGNTGAGLLDMHLRSGNSDAWAYTAQLGLIGLDASAEGPLSRKKDIRFLANYRYSTVGLLSAMGLDLGDEAIQFQDLSIHLTMPVRGSGQLSFFAVGGDSENLFTSPQDSMEWTENKDQFDITFEHRMGAVGTRLDLPLAFGGSLHTTLLWSGMQGSRLSERLSSLESLDEYTQQKWSLNTYVQWRSGEQSTFYTGLSGLLQQDDLLAIERQQPRIDGRRQRTLLQPYLNWRTQLAAGWQLEAGLRGFLLDGVAARLEPRLALDWQLNAQQRLTFSYGWQHQRIAPQIELAARERLPAMRVAHSSVQWRYQWANTTSLKVEGYYQRLTDVPISADAMTSFSAINLLEGYRQESLRSDGIGENYGVELTLQRAPTDRWYYLITGSLYESRYQGSDGVWRDTRWNGQYTANATLGREWSLRQKNKKERTLGINLRFSALGGFRTTLIDERASALTETTVYRTSEAFTVQQGDFRRLDLRIYLRRNLTGRNTTLALDIQNLTNRENEAFRYYDPYLQKIVIKNQLGLIPLLSYKVQF